MRVCAGGVGYLSASYRLQVKQNFPATFAVVDHLVDKILTTEWRSCGKRADPIVWLSSRVSICSLLMPPEAIKKIIGAGPRWRDEAEEAMTQCIDQGSTLASLLFSGCVQAVAEHRLCKHMEAAVGKLIAFRPTFAGVVTETDVQEIRATALAEAMTIPGALSELTTTTPTTTTPQQQC